eukprot:EG_transcript_13701
MSLSTPVLVEDVVNRSRRTFDGPCPCLVWHAAATRFDVFWHVTLVGHHIGHAANIIQKQWLHLQRSGVYALSTIHVGLIAQPNITAPLVLRRIFNARHTRLASFAPYDPRATDPELQASECITSTPMWQYAGDFLRCKAHAGCTRHAEGLVLYLHSKGVTHPGAMDSEDWRNLMEYYLLEHWMYNVFLMSREGAWTTGVYYIDYHPISRNNTPHYSGNFFWANLTYIASLPAPGGNRWECCEAWILLGRQPQRHVALHLPLKDIRVPNQGLYFQRYHRELYDCPVQAPPWMAPLQWIPALRPCHTALPCDGMKCPDVIDWEAIPREVVRVP